MKKSSFYFSYCIISISILFLTGCFYAPVKEPPKTPGSYQSLSIPTISIPDVPYQVKQYSGSRNWKYVVIHHSASVSGNASTFDKLHREVRGWDRGLGYHFVIGNGNGSADGNIEIGGRWKKQIDGAHAGIKEYNQYGIGICLVGNFQNQTPSDKQLSSLISLINYFQERYHIPAENVILHRHIKETACPGTNFPYYHVLTNIKVQ